MDSASRQKKQAGKERIDNRLKRINLKSKRMRNLIKKSIELSQLCDLDISMVIRDKEMDKVTVYNSGTAQKGLFTHEKALKEIERLVQLSKAIKTYSDDHYKILNKVYKNDQDDQASDPKDELEL